MRSFAVRGGVLVLLVVVAMLGLEAGGAPSWVERIPQLVVASIGTGWAASRFESSDPPRRGWVLLALAGPLALIIAALIAADVRIGGLLVGPVLIVINNVLIVWGALSLLVVLRSSGLAPPWNASWIAISLAGGLATLTVGAGVVLNLHVPSPTTGLDAPTWVVRRVVGVAADIIVFNAAVQMLRITFPMRRGLIATPYLLLALSAALFMVVGLGLALTTTLLQTELGLAGRINDTVAWCCLGLAGFAQARAVRHTAEAD